MGRMDDLGGIFEDNENGRSVSDLGEVMDFMSQAIRDDKITTIDALEALLNLVHPGKTDISHDILREFRTGMALQGQIDLGNKIEAVWLTVFPWGMGFHIGFNREFDTSSIGNDGKLAVVKSLCAILVQGGVDAVVLPNGRIQITGDDGDEQEVDIDKIVKEFRKELDEELDAPNVKPDPKEDEAISDWIRKWML